MDLEKISAKITKSTMNLKIIYKTIRFYLTKIKILAMFRVDRTLKQKR